MKHTINKAPENFKKLQAEMENKNLNIKELEEKIFAIKEELKIIEETALETYAQIDISNKQKEELTNELKQKMSELDEFKKEIDKIKEDKNRIKEEISNITIEIKRVEKDIAAVNEEIKKTAVSYAKLIEDYGFIDTFEKEVEKV